MAARDRRLRIALDAYQFAVTMVNKLTTSDAAIRADRSRHLGVRILRPQLPRRLAHRLDASSVGAGFQLSDERPLEEKLGEHGESVCKNDEDGRSIGRLDGAGGEGFTGRTRPGR